MLHLWCGHNYDTRIDADMWLKHCAPNDVLLHDFSKRAIKEIDQTEVLGENALYSKPLGAFSPDYLSTGVKAVIFLKYGEGTVPDYMKNFLLNLEVCGDNCYPFISEVANEKDIEVYSSICVNIYEYGYKGKIHIMNDDSYIDTFMELIDKHDEFEDWGL